MMKSIVLKRGRDESVRRFHPWIFSGAVASVEEAPYEGEVVEVLSHDGHFLAYGHYQKGSIAVRILTFTQDFRPSEDGRMPLAFWQDRIGKALNMRRTLGLPSSGTDCYRLVHGEGDSLPGVIVDIYGDVAVLQAHSAGMYLSADLVAEALMSCAGVRAVFNKSEGTAPHKAGLDLHDGYICGDCISDETAVSENGHKFLVNWAAGQKTGFFLDQRDNRQLVGSYAAGRKVLNLFCYTGGFSVYALNAGASSVVSVDSSAVAVGMLRRNVELNSGESDAARRHSAVCADAIDYLRDSRPGEFDLMVVDPPAFAKHRDALDNALRAYRRLNAAAISKIAPGGLLFTYSCSQAVDRKAFELAVFSAAAQTGRSVRILRRLTQPADHPVNIYHPEGDYLKGLLLYVE
ncbi:MAG TPA: class I SAM-dependent rRNA methyltransferase [Candidatus Coprenecus stercoravium]|uniref:Class I SAM-dependent rRNA methyltransferase n=1 Tax=Candidatus Coprenecus stercoravium TaxID=2840735 RepID=A0A9D2GPW7_9BACT|nr:class I SAM-dependent rRNA methyltransferase [Candidatus Coprenecus stercoravium]